MAIKNIYNTFMNLKRLRQIVKTLAHHGFAHVLMHAGLDTLLHPSLRIRTVAVAENKDISRLSNAERLALVIEELGATFIKFGQVLATRPDIMPPEYIEAFSRLQDSVDPLPYEEIKEVIRGSLGKDVNEIFAQFDSHALASGSIGQVHKAILHTGEKVVVKIKRPGTDKIIRDDLALLKYLAKVLERHFPDLRVMCPSMIVEEFSQCMIREIDFTTEAAFTAKFSGQFEDYEEVTSPEVHWDYVSHDTAVYGFFDGNALSHEESLKGIDRKAFAQKIAECFLRQYFMHGFFHADPHPGNLFVQSGGNIGIIDFGQMGQVPDDMRKHLIVMLIALGRGDVDVVVDFCSSIGVLSENTNLREFRIEFSSFVSRFFGMPISHIDLSSIINESISIARRNGLILPRDFILLTKSFVTIQGVIRKIDPAFNFNDSLKPFLSELVKDLTDPKEAAWGMGFYFYRILTLLKRAPEDIRDILTKIRGGKTRIIFHHEGLDEMSDQIERASNRITLGLLVSAILMGSSIVLASGPEVMQSISVPFIEGLPLSAVVASLGYLMAMGLGFWLALAIIRGKRI